MGFGNFFGQLFAKRAPNEPVQELNTENSDSLTPPTPLPSLDKVLDKIFIHLSLPSLKTCRLVNHHWSMFASLEIRRRSTTSLEFHQDKGSLKIFFTNPSRKLLTLLNHQLSHDHITLFCTTLEFRGNLGLQDTRHFFHLYGPQIKILVIKNHVNYFTKWTVLQKLLEETRKVQDLSILGNNFDFDISLFDPSTNWTVVPLSNLKIFRIDAETTHSTLYKILVCAPNLQLVENFDLRQIETFLQCRERPFLIKSIKFIYSVKGIEEKLGHKCHITNFNHLDLTLVTIDPASCNPEDRWCITNVSTSIQSVLNFARSTVEQMSILPVGWLRTDEMGEIIPILPSLKRLIISCFKGQPVRIFPNQLRELEEIFPVLEKVTLDLGDYSREFWFQYFPTETVLGWVTELEVVGVDQQDEEEVKGSLEEMKRMFPNLKKLAVKGNKCGVELMRTILRIWRGDQLEQIQFEGVEVVAGGCEIDSLMTGIDKEDCEHLKISLKTKAMEEETKEEVEDVLKYLRNGKTCIRDFGGLRLLRIGFAKPRGQQVAGSLSALSYKYAFDLMPNLVVKTEQL